MSYWLRPLAESSPLASRHVRTLRSLAFCENLVRIDHIRRFVSCEVSVPYVVVSRFVSTAELARILGVHRITVQKWIRLGLLKPPKLTIRNGRAVRLWSPAAVRAARRLKKGKDDER